MKLLRDRRGIVKSNPPAGGVKREAYGENTNYELGIGELCIGCTEHIKLGKTNNDWFLLEKRMVE